jgi:four helix bundle protein
MSYKVTKEASGAPGRSGNREEKAFQTFEDLEVYRVSREFRKAMYGAARRLPDFEKYALCSQIRRAAVSLTNNIAEGHGRFHYPDQIRFILHSRGSLEELVDDLNVCLDENYLRSDEVATLKKQARTVLLLINGYLRHLRRNSDAVREPDESYSENSEELSALRFVTL